MKNSTVANTVNIGNPIFSEIREIVTIWHGNSLTDHADYHTSQTNIGFFPDVTKLKTIGWSPSISLEEGIERTRKAHSGRVNPK